ncbi:type II toxin-antitoxin system RelE/ParE family toxin [bacterium]|nr:type II toxin-antitoxin system RelE/ParE family toxin [bacterium]
MLKVFITAEAKKDLLEMWLYIAEENIKAADRFLEKIDKKIKMISRNPAMGIKRQELASQIRSLVADKYVVFYLIRKNQIDIIRVLHASRDVNSIIKNSV